MKIFPGRSEEEQKLLWWKIKGSNKTSKKGDKADQFTASILSQVAILATKLYEWSYTILLMSMKLMIKMADGRNATRKSFPTRTRSSPQRETDTPLVATRKN